MSQIDRLAGLMIGIYLIAVVYQGNGNQLIAELGQQRDFLRWGLALILILYLVGEFDMGAVGTGLIALTFLGMGLSAAGSGSLGNLRDQFTKVLGG